jgi:hypothetical protein
MGLLRRPTPGEIVEDGRFSRPCGPGAHSRASQKTNLRLRRHSRIPLNGFVSLAERSYGMVISQVLAFPCKTAS